MASGDGKGAWTPASLRTGARVRESWIKKKGRLGPGRSWAASGGKRGEGKREREAGLGPVSSFFFFLLFSFSRKLES